MCERRRTLQHHADSTTPHLAQPRSTLQSALLQPVQHKPDITPLQHSRQYTATPCGPSPATHCELRSLSSCEDGTLPGPKHHYSVLRTALPCHALLTAHLPQRPANRNLLSPAHCTLQRPADRIPLSCHQCGECYTLNSSAGTRRQHPSDGLVAPYGMNPEAHCE